MIFIAYDGSEDAKAAIAEAGRLFPGEPVTIATVWQRLLDTMARAGALQGLVIDYDAVDESARKAAEKRAQEGAELASQAGLGEGRAVTPILSTNVADALLAEAKAVDARALVLGSRGLGSMKAFFLGSVSSAILHHADRPIIIVPSPEVAAARAEHLR